jgi:P22 coat protein - gene protein 5
MNTLLTIEAITLEGLRVLTNALVAAGLVNRQFDPMFGQGGAKVGDVVYARKPPRYIVRSGAGIQPQATVETRVPIKLDRLRGVDLPFSSVERTLSLDNYSDRVLKPTLAAIANAVDVDILSLADAVANAVGTPGTVPSSTTANATYLSAGVMLDDMAAPQDEQRFLITTPNMQASVVNANTAIFNPQAAISEGFKKGRYGMGVLGFDWYMDQNCPTHAEGTRTGTNNGGTWQVLNAQGATPTSSLVMDGFGATDTINVGDRFTLGVLGTATAVQSVNPQSRLATGALQVFVATAPGANSGGTITVPIYPEINTSGQFQTVNQVAANNAEVIFLGSTARTYRQGVAGHRDAFTLVTAPLELPKGVHEAFYAGDDQTGVGVRIVTAYDIRTNEMITRFDVLYGVSPLRPELACVVNS